MIFTREQQHKMLVEYTKKKRSVDEITGFIDGISETIKLIDKLAKENKNEQ